MTGPLSDAKSRVADPNGDAVTESREPGFIDALRILYRRRISLMVHFVVILSLGLVAFLYSNFTAPKKVEGTLSLNFRGIEKNQYPSGKTFSAEDFRSPEVLSMAIADADLTKKIPSSSHLAAHVFVTPLIPAEVQNRWMRQEKEGLKKDEYYPSQFSIGIDIQGLSDAQLIRLYDALVRRYQERVKYDQEAARAFVAPWKARYDNLADRYDLWDIPELFRQVHQMLDKQLNDLITASLQYQDSKYQLAFLATANDLATWSSTRLQSLEALTYQGQIVRDRDIVLQRTKYQIDDLDIRIRQTSKEADEAAHLLGILEEPKRALLAGQVSSREGLPMLDAGALDRLVKNDYVGPVVQRISKLQQNIRLMSIERAQLEKQLSILPRAKNTSVSQLPPGYKELIQTVSTELTSIILNYNRILDEYLTATVVSLVVENIPPQISKPGYSSAKIIPAIVFLSLFLAVFLISVEHLIRKASSAL